MISSEAKGLFEKLDMPYPAVALKFHVCRPQGVPKYDGQPKAFCEFLHDAQVNEGSFYMTAEDDSCNGKVILGMADKPPVAASGQSGPDFEMYRQNAANRRIYQEMPVLVRGTCNYVQFTRLSECDFDPDLVVCVADADSAYILLRATSYISGDFWESRSTPVISCCWMYSYPVITGKVNFITTGFYHGLKRRKMYPAGLTMISIPFRKLDEVCTALGEMPWTTIAFREDEESKAELERRMVRWKEMADECSDLIK